MIRQSKHPIKLKAIVLVIMYVGLIVFSLLWYDALTGMNCSVSKPMTSYPVNMSSSEAKIQNCNEQLHFHWIKFYGINGIIYGASLLVIVVNARKGKRN